MENNQSNKVITFKSAMTEYERLQEQKAAKFAELGDLENTEAIENYLMLSENERRLFFNINEQGEQKNSFKDALRYSRVPIIVKMVAPTPPMSKTCPSCVAARANYDIKFNQKWKNIVDNMDLDLKRLMLLSEKYKDYIIMNKAVIDSKLFDIQPIQQRLDELAQMFSVWYDVQIENKKRITKPQLEFLNRWFKFE
jgi:hypothetical protein